MMMAELEHERVLTDPASALEQSKADADELETKHAAAEAALADADGERAAASKTLLTLNRRVSEALATRRAAKREAMAASAAAGSVTKEWVSADAAKVQHERLLAVLEYHGLVVMEDAARGALVAKLDERTAFADLTEARATRARLGLLVAAADASQYDPGSAIDPGGSWSQQQMAVVANIRAIELPNLRQQIADHDQRVTAQRNESKVWF